MISSTKAKVCGTNIFRPTTTREIESQSFNNLNLRCDECKSDVIETSEGFTCPNCGLVLELPRLEDKDQIFLHNNYQRNSSRNLSSPGFKRRTRNLQLTDSQRKEVKIKNEIKRICSQLKYFEKKVELIHKFYTQIRLKMPKEKRFFGSKRVIPVIIYLFCLSNKILIKRKELLEYSDITSTEFNKICSHIIRYYPTMQKIIIQNRPSIIKQIVYNAIIALNLDILYYQIADEIVNKFWKDIGNIINKNVAAICLLLVVVGCETKEVTISKVCYTLEVDSYKIAGHIRELIKRYDILGYSTLKKSAPAIITLLAKKEVFESEESFIFPNQIIFGDVQLLVPSNIQTKYLIQLCRESQKTQFEKNAQNLKKMITIASELELNFCFGKNKRKFKVEILRFNVKKAPPNFLLFK